MSIRSFQMFKNLVSHQRLIKLSTVQNCCIIQNRNFSSEDNDKNKPKPDGTEANESSAGATVVETPVKPRQYSERSK